ncbi:AAA family ATPase [Kineococcus sp. NPDC059986]|uniref:AAA family ATPase n=1 Tax=Kineococcus sp. NPDC059986 TaxID=3155538 RepID=UPI00344E20F2
MSRLLVIAGPPGAGKTTVSTLVSARLTPSVLLRGDAFFRFLDQGAQEPWRPEAEEQNRTVVRASGAAAGQFVKGGYEAVFDGVLGPWFLPTFLAATGLDAVHYAVLLPSADRCARNVAAREGHDRDEPGTRSVHRQFEISPLDDRHLVDPVGSPEEVAAVVAARYDRGEFVRGARDDV